jgi:chromosome segregation ATPase
MSVSDLIPGDPEGVRQVAEQFGEVASEAEGRLTELRNAMSRYAVGDSDTWRGQAASKASERLDALARALQQVFTSFDQAGSILGGYAGELEEAQAAAQRLQQRQQEAGEELQQVRTETQQIEEYRQQIQENAVRLEQEAEADVVADPEAAAVIEAELQQYLSALNQQLAEYQQKMSELEQQASQLEEQVSRAERELEQLKESWDQKGAEYAQRIGALDTGSVIAPLLGA